ncbi:MAG: exodeoxyribonuclease VII small subunit [Caulobacterales bacterium]|nr:exodeoxyribonuclease VII small subunit [Caulobacterales bacterium]
MADKATARAERPADSLSFEEALAELEEIVRQLESGDVELERSIAIYERGAALKTHCEKKLETARLKVEKIVLAPGGGVAAEPADVQ